MNEDIQRQGRPSAQRQGVDEGPDERRRADTRRDSDPSIDPESPARQLFDPDADVEPNEPA